MGLRRITKTVLDAPLLLLALGGRAEFVELLRIIEGAECDVMCYLTPLLPGTRVRT